MIHRHAPPNFDKIVAAFPGAAKPMASTDNSSAIPYFLRAHESVHQSRQLEKGVERWWDLYIADVNFRYHEELLGHAAEYQSQIRLGSRNLRRVLLKATAKRLTAPLYGYHVPMDQAITDLRDAVG